MDLRLFLDATRGAGVEETGANPFIVLLLFLVRCLVPLALLLGLSYLLRRLGWIAEPTPPPGIPNGGQEQTPINQDEGDGRHVPD
jgi:hypothetical protein